MSTVKTENTAPPPGYGKAPKRKGRKPLADEMRRELVSVRMLPRTRRALEAMEYENLGRAIDAAIEKLEGGASASGRCE